VPNIQTNVKFQPFKYMCFCVFEFIRIVSMCKFGVEHIQKCKKIFSIFFWVARMCNLGQCLWLIPKDMQRMTITERKAAAKNVGANKQEKKIT